MSEAAIRTAIKTTLSTVSNIGKVHDYERWSTDWTKFIAFFKTQISGTNQIRGWEIGRKAPVTEDETSVKKHTFSIKGYMGVEDESATEKAFNTLIEAIAAAFRSDRTLAGSALGHDFIQVEVLDTRSFGGVLCHYVELSLTVYEHIG